MKAAKGAKNKENAVKTKVDEKPEEAKASETPTQDRDAGSAGAELRQKDVRATHFQAASFKAKIAGKVEGGRRSEDRRVGNAAYANLTGGRPLARDAPRGARRKQEGLNKRTAGP